MLKISSRNQKLNARLSKKETQLFLHHLFGFFFKKKKFVPTQWPWYLNYWDSKLLVKSPFTKTRTICFLTGRSRSVYRVFHLSRIKLREFAGAGYFNGLSKASW